jgi:hypothetical protein
MITQTINWSFFHTEKKSLTAEDLGIVENQNLPLKAYLRDLKKHKKQLNAANIVQISVYYTVFYEGQCNAEFDLETLSLLKDLKATFCVTCQEI